MDRIYHVAINTKDPVGKEDAMLEYEKNKKEWLDKKSELEFYETEIRGLEEESE